MRQLRPQNEASGLVLTMGSDVLARRSRNQIHTSVLILQKTTKGTKNQGGNHGSLFPWLPFVKDPGFERLGNRGGQDARRKTSSSDIVVQRQLRFGLL
jgi:hypothetical protein